MKQQLLLLQDVDSLGKKGEVVIARPGYIRNFLLPQGFAIIATPHTLKKQERLRQERSEQAVVDRKDAEDLSQKIEGLKLEIRVKVDPEGHMYGSVSASDIADLLQTQGIALDKKHVQLPKPIKTTGSHKISFKLKEGVPGSCILEVLPEGGRKEVAAEPLPVAEEIPPVQQ
ncbi:MAG TPA: 50S ribosomal protein L9 [Chlamydiales bacterium]|nr:50S ribosomal protein L9 [Chlamydiales bacterium]